MKNILLILLLIYFTFSCCDDSIEPKNNPPTISNFLTIPDKVKESDSTTVICIATDGDGDELTYVWSAESGSILGTVDSVIWVAPNSVGFFSIKCKVLDGNGGQAAECVLIEVIQKMPIEGLIAYWPFNGNANDESGNEINGTVIGPILTSDRHGNNNSAYSFDGQNDYIEAEASKLPSAERTISLWFYANTVENRPGLLGYGGISGKKGTSWLMGLNMNGRKSFHMSCHWLINRIDYYYTNSPVEDWYHCVITTDSNGTRIYINGVEEVSNTTFVSNTYVDARELGIGVVSSPNGIVPYADGNTKYFYGSIDDIRIYNRALNESEIQVLYHEDEWNI